MTQQENGGIIEYALKNQPGIGETTLYIQLAGGKIISTTFPNAKTKKFDSPYLEQIGTVIFRLRKDSSHYYPYNETEIGNMYKFYTENKLDTPVTLQMVVNHNTADIFTKVLTCGGISILIFIVFLIIMLRLAFRHYTGKNVVSQMIKAKRKDLL